MGPGATIGQVSAPEANVLLAMFGKASRARSKWIPIQGLAASAKAGLGFRFDGTNLRDGSVPDVNLDSVVDELPPLLGPTALGAAPSTPFVAAAGTEIVFDASSLLGTLDDVYLRNPALLRRFLVRLESTSTPVTSQSFEVAAALYTPGRQLLRLSIDASGPSIIGFAPGAAVVSLVPRFYSAVSGGVPDTLDINTGVELRFQATSALPNGQPNGDGPLMPFTTDATQLADPAAAYYRFEVLFRHTKDGSPVDMAALPSLDFLRLPIRF